MKKYFLIVVLLFPTVNCWTQFMFFNSTSYKYYVLGTRELQVGNYAIADSLLTISLNARVSKDALFNRGIARYIQNDTVGFCTDMNLASNYFYD